MADAPRTPWGTLERLGRHLGSPPSALLGRFCDHFAGALGHFAELGLQGPEPRLGVLTQGCGGAFMRLVADFFESEGFDRADFERVGLIQERLDDWMLLRLSDARGGGDDAEIGFYFRKAIGIELAVELLAELGTQVGEQEQLRHLASMLNADKSSLFGARLRRGSPVVYTLHMHAWGDRHDPLADNLFEVFKQLQIPGPWPTFVEAMHGQEFGHGIRDVFVTPILNAESRFDALELEYFTIDVELIDDVLDHVGLLPNGHVLTAVAAELGVKAAEHVGIHFGADEVQWASFLRRSPVLS